jgi:hypothetical protein
MIRATLRPRATTRFRNIEQVAPSSNHHGWRLRSEPASAGRFARGPSLLNAVVEPAAHFTIAIFERSIVSVTATMTITP